MEKEKYMPPGKHSVPPDYDTFYASLTEDEKMLNAIAEEKLGSSYFVGWTHMYKKWQESTKK